MYIQYADKNLSKSSLQVVEWANVIIAAYDAQGYRLTLRQLYYQLVARDLIPNNIKSYKRIGRIMADARMVGLVSWEALEDRTRNLQRLAHWTSPESIVQTAAKQYRRDHWEGQRYYVEVWVEKEALSSIVGRACHEMDVPYIACKGYMSISEMWEAGRRFASAIEDARTPVIIHLGDHDPSGIDMTRDIDERLNLFLAHEVGVEAQVERIALNYDQVLTYRPPRNPAKMTDSRIGSYLRDYGRSSWELDALPPDTLHNLIVDKIGEYRDEGIFNEVVKREKSEVELVKDAAAFVRDRRDD